MGVVVCAGKSHVSCLVVSPVSSCFQAFFNFVFPLSVHGVRVPDCANDGMGLAGSGKFRQRLLFLVAKTYGENEVLLIDIFLDFRGRGAERRGKFVLGVSGEIRAEEQKPTKSNRGSICPGALSLFHFSFPVRVLGWHCGVSPGTGAREGRDRACN